MNVDNKEQMLEATLVLISKEKEEMFSHYIDNDEVRRFIAKELHGRGYTVINAVPKKILYVALR